MQFCELSGFLINAINAALLSTVGSSCVPVLWVGGLLLGLFFIPSGKRVSYFMASGTLSVCDYHLDGVVYVCSSAAFWKPLPSCISTECQVFKLSALQFVPSRA